MEFLEFDFFLSTKPLDMDVFSENLKVKFEFNFKINQFI